jgi:glycerate kinase
LYRILICPNAFKGSLTAMEAADSIRIGIEKAVVGLTREGAPFREPVAVDLLPLADGGDGTLQTLVAATGGTIVPCRVTDPLGRPVEAAWGRLGGAESDTAVIEMALASGLALLRPDERDPRRASTYGTGELMRAALDAGCRKLIVGIGGSATNDGGAGMAEALGARFLDSGGAPLEPGGAALARLAAIDLSGMRLPGDTEIFVACDVDNPLVGPEGASTVYGPQKGATPEMVQELDAALAHFAAVVEQQMGKSVARTPGSGAAGGLGAGLLAFCGAQMRSGLDLAMELTEFDARVRACSLVITGEGRLDGQTVRGKVIAGVARRARAAGVPVVALCGSVEEGAELALRPIGLNVAFSILDRPMTVEDAMRDASRLLSNSAERLVRMPAIQ